MDWRIAKALLQLREQVNAKYPKRSTASDGAIGDAAHATRDSDHNPWVKDKRGQPIVTAIDITHDPAHGFDSYAFAEELRVGRDPRIKYIISNGKIFSSIVDPWQWRAYNGSNRHDKHVHISVKGLDQFFDDTESWKAPMLDGTGAVAAPAQVVEEPVPTLREIQAGVNRAGYGPITEDGKLGPQTLKAMARVLKGAKS